MEFFYRYVMTPIEFQNWKIGLIEMTGLARDALHVYFGLGLFLVARFVFGQRRWSGPVAWGLVAFFALLGEVMDLKGRESVAAIFNESAHLHDVVNTLFWPTILLLFGGAIFAKPSKAEPSLSDQVGNQSLE